MILDKFKLDGRTALVTGSNQGIGQSYALALSRSWCRYNWSFL